MGGNGRVVGGGCAGYRSRQRVQRSDRLRDDARFPLAEVKEDALRGDDDGGAVSRGACVRRTTRRGVRSLSPGALRLHARPEEHDGEGDAEQGDHHRPGL
ncbi:hypothetical protein AB1Y20_019911 [Prymnesium parvum]|uniref:Uncharacterized protein n=1 Tax=Prymnesium parvum TaxID=97485 RepID=A0AB34JVU2_PRYPA